MKCKVCGKQYRKGSLAFVMCGRGLKGARVCQGCASDGVLLVAARAAQVKTVEKGPPAATEVLKYLKAQLKGLKATQRLPSGPMEDEFVSGKCEGLENAIDALEGKRA